MSANITPIPVAQMMSNIVGELRTNLLSTLQAFDANIKTIRYEHGHPTEIIETLRQAELSKTEKYQKYPIVMLFQDFDDDKGNSGGYAGNVSLHIVIANSTLPTYKAAERYTNNLNPVLIPIYEELIRLIGKSKYFVTYGKRTIKHRKTERLFWGRNGLYGNQSNVFNDYLDVIEITNLNLTLNYKTILNPITNIHGR